MTKAQFARHVLTSCGVDPGADFYALSSGTVDRLLAFADLQKYRAPKNANGSRGRYYHAKLQREARQYTAREISQHVFGNKATP